MAYDTQTRNRLQSFVSKARKLLCGEYNKPGGEITLQLQRFGIQPDGTVADLDEVPNLSQLDYELGQTIRSVLEHKRGNEAAIEAWGYDPHVYDLIQEQGFTVLNRLCALRLAEERGILPHPVVSNGINSDGFQLYEMVVDKKQQTKEQRYQDFLFSVFDELSLDLGILFDRHSPQGLLFPDGEALNDLLEILNDEQLSHLWTEDETIGWVYQYWNSKEERKAMRDASAAPRNSRELAVRNQFFTPRYVVEFLIDNTLGRIWYEMCRGETRLKEECRYLVRRPHEIFLETTYSESLECRPWVEQVLNGDYSAAEEDATWDEISAIALALGDGYKIAEQLCLGDVHEYVASWFTQVEKTGEIDETIVYTRQGSEETIPDDSIVSNNSLDTIESDDESRKKSPHSPRINDSPTQQGTLGDCTLLNHWLLLFSAQRTFKETRLDIDEQAAKTYRCIWRAWIAAANTDDSAKNLSQEELLLTPVFVAPRPLKDPREIRLLDPACGSMHFGLYAFDLYEKIYDEAWQKGLVPRKDFGYLHQPILNHSSVSKSGQAIATSNYSNQKIELEEACVVVLAKDDSGDGVFAGIPYLVEKDQKFRVDESKRTPFAEFDYYSALEQGDFTEEAGESLLRTSQAFSFGEQQAASEEEALQRYLLEIPKMIIEHNIHGVDIDPRAVQIAGLSLWLRAQKNVRDIPASERPQVRKSNIVCAEPMPGNEVMLEDFVKTLDPPLLGELVKTVFDKMQLAGEAGTLLNIEEEIRSAIDGAKAAWERLGNIPEELFSADELNQTLKPSSQQELTGFEKALTNHRPLTTDFWETAEERIYAALSQYAESAEVGDYQRRLFAEDAAHGFAFIDLCRRRYEAVVMNPPFGEWSALFKSKAKQIYPSSYNDILAAFVERGGHLLDPGGRIGAITSRTGFFLTSFTKWRDNIVLEQLHPELLADLGHGIMDAAMVEAAAYVLSKPLAA